MGNDPCGSRPLPAADSRQAGCVPSQPTRSKPESDATLAEYRESMPPGLARRAVTREQVAEAVSTRGARV